MTARRKRRKLQLKFLKRMQKKLVVMFVAVSLMLIGLVARLMYIEYTSGEKYVKIVLAQQGYDSQTIPYQRGDIVDAKGTIFATSIAVYNVILDCSVMTSDEKYIDPTISALCTCFQDLDKNELYSYAREQEKSKYIILKKKISYEEIQPFIGLQEEENEDGELVNPNIKGVWFEKEYQREYPLGSLASAVVGFTTSGNVGINGLENFYNDRLNGLDGRQYGYLNNDNDFEKTIKPAINGNTLVTTIDANIQTVVEKKIAEFNEAYKGAFRAGDDGATHIGVLLMDPNNGDVLAMANYPNYDLGNPRDLSAYYTKEELDAMNEDEKLDQLNKLWQNFCTTYTYEPGSTAKTFTIATGLETGAMSGGETYYCDGFEMMPGYSKPIRCVSRSGHGMQTISESLMNSCNDALMQMSYVIGAEDFTKYQQIFGFGQKTNIDLPGEARTDTLIYTLENMTKIDLATNSFGQNYNTTMIQLATAFCSLVNDGTLYQPHVVKRIVDEKGNTIENITPTVLRQTVSKSTGDKLKSYMQDTVALGTGNTAKVDGYSMGGKTGTAQKRGRDGVNYVVSFIGFAPVEDPKLVIYCVVDEPNAEEQYHSTFAQNIAREILEEVLPYLNIYRDEEATGLHAGWDIRGEEAGQQALTDIVNGDHTQETGPMEGELDVPDTGDRLEGNQDGSAEPGGDTPPEGENEPEGDTPEEGGNTPPEGENEPEGDTPEEGGNTPPE